MADAKAVATVDVEARRRQAMGELANTSREFTETQVAVIKNTIGKDLTNEELRFFIGVCSRTGLDPFLKQVYPIKYSDKMTIQVGIDGYRAMASSTGLYDGQDPPQWCGPDGQWRDVWLEDVPPYAARVAVYRKDISRPIVAVCRYSAYAVMGRDGKPTQMWDRMDAEQLAKCAESLALRKAFPKDLAGVTTTEEALVDVPRDPRAAALPSVRADAERSVAEVMNGHDSEDEAPDSIADQLNAEMHEAIGVPPEEFVWTCTKAKKVLNRIFLKDPVGDGRLWFVDAKVQTDLKPWPVESFMVIEGGEYVDAPRAQAIYGRLREEIAAAVARAS